MVAPIQRPGTCRQSLRARNASPIEGYVLLTSLFALLLLATAALLVFSVVTSEQRQQRRHHQSMELRALNDALLAETLAELSHSKTFSGVAPRTVGSGSGRSTVTKITQSRSHVKTIATLGSRSLTTGTMINVSGSVPRVLSWRRLQSSPLRR